MKNLKPIINLIFSRCLFLYGLIFLVLLFSVNLNTTKINHLNYLRDESYFNDFLSGQEIFKKEKLLDTIRYYDYLVHLGAKSSCGYANLGFCYFYLGDYSQALQYYNEAIKLNPFLYSLPFDRAVIAVKLLDFKKAQNDFEISFAKLSATDAYYARLTQEISVLHEKKMSQDMSFLLLRLRQDEKLLSEIRSKDLSILHGQENSLKLHFYPEWIEQKIF